MRSTGCRDRNDRRRCWRACSAAALLLACAPPCLAAARYYLAVDVPTRLSGTDYPPNRLIQSENGAYTEALALPEGLQLGALHRGDDGTWYFSPAHAVRLAGPGAREREYEARDIVATDGVQYWPLLDGGDAGLPEEARIDALFFETTPGPLVLSFDIPVTLGGTDFAPSDLVLMDGSSFSLYWDAAARGVPEEANLVGAALDPAGDLVVSFDIPVTLGAADYLPGELVRWSQGTFSSAFRDGSWPEGSQLRDFAIVSSGANPQEAGQFVVSRGPGSSLHLDYTPACGAADHAVYWGMSPIAGALAWTNSTCGIGQGGMVDFNPGTPPVGAFVYFVVVGYTAEHEGSYGLDSADSQRPEAVAIGTCDLPLAIGGTCP